MINYIALVGEFYPGTNCYSEGQADDYNSIVWESTAITQVDLDVIGLVKEKTDKILIFSEYAREEIENGYFSSALGTPHLYDSQPEDQLNIIGAVTSNVDMDFGCREPTAGTQVVDLGGAVVGTDATGLVNDTTTYDVEIQFDGTPTYVSVNGQDAQTYDDLITEIQTDLDLTSVGPIALVDGNLTITSSTLGSSSTVNVVPTTLFNSLTQFVGFATPVDGADANAFVKEYKFHTHAQLLQVLNDGAIVKLTTLQKFNVKRAQIMNAVDSAAVAAITWE